MSPPKFSRKGKEANKAYEKWSNPTTLAMIVGGIVLIGILLSIGSDSTDASSQQIAMETFLRRSGMIRKKVEFIKISENRKDVGYGVFAKGSIPRGETVMKIPKELLIDVREIMQRSEINSAIGREENSKIDLFIKEKSYEQSFFYFVFSYFLVNQRDTPGSDFSAWVQMLPLESEMETGIQWDRETDDCLDQATKNELSYFRKLLDGMIALNQEICDGTKCKPLSEEDLRWGLSIYRSRSFQDQALVIPVDFFNHGQSNVNTQIEWNAEENVVEVKTTSNLKKGDELFIHYGATRSPVSLLVSHGFPETSINFYPAPVQMDLDKNPLLKQYECNKKNEIGYLSSGKPKTTLLSCVNVLVASEEQRENWKNIYRKKDNLHWAEILMQSYGNLTYGIEVMAQQIRPPQDVTTRCAQLVQHYPYLEKVTKVQMLTMDFLVRAHNYLTGMYKKAEENYVALGGILPEAEQQKPPVDQAQQETENNGN